LYNCNDFVADAAEAIGLKAPLLRVMPPVLFIHMLDEINAPDSGPTTAIATQPAPDLPKTQVSAPATSRPF